MKKGEKARADKAKNIRIDRLYGRACEGLMVAILDLEQVYEVGRRAIDEGADDDALALALRAKAETICIKEPTHGL